MYYKGQILDLKGYIAAKRPTDDEELYDVIADYLLCSGLAEDGDADTIEFYGFEILDFKDVLEEEEDHELDDPSDDEPDHERYE